MSVTLELEGTKAIITEGVWKSENATVKDLCDFYMIDQPYTPQPSDPNPDHTVAVYVAEKLGAKITNFDIPESVEGRVY